MKKRLLSILVALCMLASLFPVSAFAEEPELEGVTEEFIEPADAMGAFEEAGGCEEPPHEHVYIPYVTEPTCTEQGYTAYICECGDSYVADYTDALNHPYSQIIPEIPATCTSDGVSAGKQCLLCGQIVEGCEPIPAAGHVPMDVAEVPATETSTGTTAGTICAVCREILSGCEVIPALTVSEPPAAAMTESSVGDENLLPAPVPAESASGTASENHQTDAGQENAAAESSSQDGVSQNSDYDTLSAENTEEVSGTDSKDSVVYSGDCGANLTWALDDKGKLVIFGDGDMANYSSSLEVPWYECRNGVFSVVIASGVTTVGDYAFSALQNLTSAELPSGITAIGSYAFSGCAALSNVDIPDGVYTIGERAFSGCSAITDMSIPSSVNEIGAGVFENTGLQTVELPDELTSIANSAFAGCSALESIALPDTVSAIGENAFYGCTSLASVDFPGMLNSIDDSAFAGCSSLQMIIIPESVTEIGTLSFAQCGNLTSITLQGAMPTIATDAFQSVTATVYYNSKYSGYSSDTMLQFGGELTWEDTAQILTGTCGENLTWAFDERTGVLTISGTGEMNDYDDYSYYRPSWEEYKAEIAEIKVENGVTGIGQYAFYEYDTLEKVSLPASITSMGFDAFYGCASASVYYDGTIAQWNVIEDNGGTYYDEEYGYYRSCISRKLVKNIFVQYDGTSTSIDSFCGDSMTWALNNGTLTISGSGAMWDFSKTYDNTYDNYITTAPWRQNHDEITSITIQSGVTTIGSYAFYGCTNTQTISIPVSVTSIGASAFDRCRNLELLYAGKKSQWTALGSDFINYYYRNSDGSAYIREGKTGSLSWILTRAGKLTISGTGAMPDYSQTDDYYYDDVRGEWVYPYDMPWEPCNVKSVVISAGVTSIGNNAFREEPELNSVSIANSVQKIGDEVFRGCEFLSSITIPSGVREIGTRAFLNCSALTSISLPDTITALGSSYYETGGIFGGCTNLQSAKLPAGIQSVPGGIFMNCRALSKVTLPNKATGINSRAFYGCTSLKTITVPASVTWINDSAFYGCTGLTNVVLESSQCSIYGSAFYGCTSLKSIGTIRYAGNSAFYGCKSLSAIVVRDWGEIGEKAFYGCTGLKTAQLDTRTIGISAFEKCTGLTTLMITTALQDVGYYAFDGCTSLKTVKYQGTKAQWNEISIGEYNAPLKNASKTYNVIDAKPGPTISSLYKDNNGVQIKWNSVSGEFKYRVFRKTGTGSWTKLEDTTALNYTDKTAQNGTAYSYTVRCTTSDGKSYTTGYDTKGKSITPLANPALPTLATNIKGVQVKWTQVAGAGKYRLYRKTGSESWTKVADTTALSYVDTNVKSNTKYTYTVRCLAADGKTFVSGFNTSGKTITYLAAPVLSGVSNVNGGVQVKWNKVDGAEKYRVFRKASGGSWTKLGDTTALTWTDKTAASGTVYSYTARCITKDGKSYTSAYDTSGKTITYLAAPVLSSVAAGNGGVQVKWNKVTGAVKYRVLRKTGSGSWERLVDTTAQNYTDKTAQSGTTYTYTVRCISADGASYTSGYNTTGKTVKYVAAPAVPTLTASKGQVTVKWTKVTGAEKYRVYRKEGTGSWTKLADTTALTYTDKNVKAGTTYSYTIRCVSSDGKTCTSGYNGTGASITAK